MKKFVEILPIEKNLNITFTENKSLFFEYILLSELAKNFKNITLNVLMTNNKNIEHKFLFQLFVLKFIIRHFYKSNVKIILVSLALQSVTGTSITS